MYPGTQFIMMTVNDTITWNVVYYYEYHNFNFNVNLN